MREFTKSMMSYTWAMSLFGVQQMVNIFRPSKAVESFENVTEATREEFGEALRAGFRAGDNLQRGLVDLTFSIFTLGMSDGRGASRTTTGDIGRQSAEAFRQGVRAVGQTANAVGQTVEGAAYAAAGATQPGAGWAATPGAAGHDSNTRASADSSYTRGPAAPAGGQQQQAQASRPPGASGGQAQGWGPMPSQTSDPSRR